MKSDYDLVSELERTGIVSLSILERVFEKVGVQREDAKKSAEDIIHFFGYSDRFVDNGLPPKVRDLFSIAEFITRDSSFGVGILDTYREETTLPPGSRCPGTKWDILWRVWRMNRIYEILLPVDSAPKQDIDKNSTVYDGLSDEAWDRPYASVKG
ncbi:MAG: hypothetical protein PHC66_02030 [Candidatus Nanoarchaeia archaeon]|nr:hypothetical protein [Candidatus Nanoarchaeia archaeon]MDD5239746.1 hypothetical protein [Candidatus Nanoarchaeia archaeon]